jgi:dTDP-4-dehydrorhamnose reductase
MRILVTGAGGQVGSEVVHRGSTRELSIVGLSHAELDITNATDVESELDWQSPELVVNAAAYTGVDRAEEEPKTAFAANRDGPANLARWCFRQEVPLLHLSTDYIFDGRASAPLSEDHPPAPLGVYGQSKFEGEQLVRQIQPDHVILRTSWLFGARGGPNFVRTTLRLSRERPELRVVADQTGCPTCAADVADVILALASILREKSELPWGTYHYCGSPATTWHGFAEEIVAQARTHGPLTARHVRAISTAEYPTRASRPAYSVLSCERIENTFSIQPRDWREGLKDVLKEICHE